MTTTTAQTIDAGAEAGNRFGARLVEVLGRAAWLGLAGAGAGLVTLGAGSRLAMRLVALTSGQIGTAVRPESGAIPGELTAEGTMFLLLAGTLVGIVPAVFVGVLLHRWLPTPPPARRAVMVALIAALPAAMLLDPSNEDFARFGPRWFAVLVFLACAVGYAALVAAAAERVPVPRGRGSRIVWLLLGGAALVGATMAPGAAGGITVGVPVTAMLLLATLLSNGGRMRWLHSRRAQTTGAVVMTSAAVVAVGFVAWQAGQILIGV